ncbi:MAG: hypothetical protein RLZZ139_812 [Cyanobacteriota bacterium]
METKTDRAFCLIHRHSLLLARGRDRLKTRHQLRNIQQKRGLLLARGRDRLETPLAKQDQGGNCFLLLARGCDRLETHILVRKSIAHILAPTR